MPLLTKEELNVYEKLVNLTQKEMVMLMGNYLKERYANVIVTDNFIYAVGDIPIALVAHMDTVFEEAEKTFQYNGKTYKKPPRQVTIYYDQWKEVLASADGIGNDDRAGVYAIIRIIDSGLRPSVILTTDEEIGAVGASKMVNVITKPLSDLNYIIQLDRQGRNDCVFYDLDYKEFETYIESYGFKTQIGSMSDISVICPAWNVAGVNLSIGYFDEHTVNEILCVDAWLDTIKKVKNMLKTADNKKWEYRKRKNYAEISGIYGDYPGWDDDYGYDYMFGQATCKCCGLDFDTTEMMPILNEDGKVDYYCFECYAKVEECDNCGELFFKKKPEWKYCSKCSKEMKKFWKRKRK